MRTEELIRNVESVLKEYEDNATGWVSMSDRLPEESHKDLLLMVHDIESDEYHCDIGYYRGLDSDNRPMFDNANYGWVNNNDSITVVAWSQIPEFIDK